jgi:hypothetical protein
MGAWGYSSFENDSALDWADDLEATNNLDLITSTLSTVVNNIDYVEVDEGSYAVAAAEVVAALKGQPSTALPECVQSWIQRHHLVIDNHIQALAIRAVQRILQGGSELQSLWAEGDDYALWEKEISDLLSRLHP